MPTRVFISYTHDSEAHRQRVRELADRLRSEGIDARLDQYEPHPPKGWPRWMDEELAAAEFALAVCTPTYRRRFEGDEELGKGKGASWEGMLAQQLLYDANSLNTKLIPVVFEGGSAEDIPRVLRPFTYYWLPSGYDELYRHLTRQPKTPPAPLGQVRVMPQVTSPPMSLPAAASTSEASRAGGRGQQIDNRGAVIGTMINVSGTLQLGTPSAPAVSPAPPASPSGSDGRALALWREKLAFLLEQEPLTVDPAEKFRLSKLIAEARAKLRELSGSEVASSPVSVQPGTPSTSAASSPSTSSGEGWDVFLSHAPADAAAVHELALELHGLGLRVFLDAWEIGPGDVVVHRLDQGLRESRTGVLVVSSASLRWPQVMQEYAVLLTRAVERGQRLIPVVLEIGEGEELPPMLATRMPVDLRGVTGEARRLKVESIAGAIRGERPGPPRR